jgi:hypothetical protein
MCCQICMEIQIHFQYQFISKCFIKIQYVIHVFLKHELKK